MGDEFDILGLGIEITLIDGTEAGTINIVNNFNMLERSASTAATGINRSMAEMEQYMGMMMAGESLSKMGSTFTNLGMKGVEAFKTIGESIVSTSSEFQAYRIQLEALYKDPVKGDQMFAWAKQVEQTMPMTIDTILQAVTRFQGASMDITHTLSDGYAAINALSDLSMGMHRDPTNATKAIEEIVTANNWREMQMGFMIPKALVQESMGQTFSTDMTPEGQMQRYNLIMEYIESRFGNMTEKMRMSWTTLHTSLMSQWTLFKAAIGDETNPNGFMVDFDATMQDLYNTIRSNGPAIQQLETVIGNALKNIWDAIVPVIHGIENLVLAFADFSKQHPELASWIIDVIALSSVVLVLGGIFLTFAGQAITAVASLAMLNFTMEAAEARSLGLGTMFRRVGTALLESVGWTIIFAAAAFAIYEAWNTNFLGIRDTVTTTLSNLKEGLTDVYNVMSASTIEDFRTRIEQIPNSFSWTKDIINDLLLLQLTLSLLFGNQPSTLLVQEIDAQGLQSQADQVKTFVENVKSFLAGLSEGISNFVTDVTPVVDTVVSLFESIGNTIEDLAGKFGITLNSMGTDKWHNLGNEIGYVGSVLVTFMIAEKLLGIAAALGAIGKAMGIFTILGTGLEIAGGLLQSVYMILRTIGAVIVAAVATIFDIPVLLAGVIVAAVAMAGVLIYDHWDQIKKFGIEAADNIKREWSDFTTAMGKFAEDAKNAFEEKWKPVADWWKTNVSDPMQKQQEEQNKQSEKDWENTKDYWKGVWLEVSDWWKTNVSDPLQKQNEDDAAKRKKEADDTKAYWQGVWTEFSDWWKTHVSDPLQKQQEDAEKQSEQRQKANEQYWEQVWTNFSDWWKTNVSDPVNKILQDDEKKSEDIQAAVYKFWQDTWNEFSTWWTTNVSDPLTKDLDSLSKFFTDFADGIYTYWSSKFSALGNFLQPLVNLYNSVTGSVSNDVAKKEYEGKTGQVITNEQWLHMQLDGSVPPAATGGYIPKEGVVNLHPGEVVLNASQVDKITSFIDTLGPSSNDNLGGIFSLEDSFKDYPSSTPASSPIHNISNSSSSSADHSIHIDKFTVQVVVPESAGGNIDKTALANDIIDEIKKIQTENDMLSYRDS